MRRLLTLGLSIVLNAGAFGLPALAGVEPNAANNTENTKNAEAVTGALNKSSDPWWKHAVIYEIYPRSFNDTKGDGVGDLNGITARLDYLKDLGIDAIWLTPCYPSPQVDFGYDISDYCAIAPEYGTMADFDRLVAEAKKRNIKIIMDLVMNHTSDKHKWFIESRSSGDNPKRDWYIWRDGKNGGPPNNWQSIFGHSAWKLDPTTGQYYYHLFYAEQPDLNWRNPEVRKAMYDVARFWLDRGVAGFRLDAILALYEDAKLTDNPIVAGTNNFGDPNMENKYNDRLPEVHDTLRELRHVLDAYPGDRVLIGETGGRDVAELSTMFGKNLDEIQLPMNFHFAYLNRLSAPDFRQRIQDWIDNPAHGWPLFLFSNHDQVRHYVRYGDGKNNDQIAKLTATLLLTLPGTPILYYGEELGMENNNPKRIEDVYDPIGKTGWPKEIGRDGERTPMQWDASKYAGFSSTKPWLMPPASSTTHNVDTEAKDPNSILNFYKKLVEMRRKDSQFQQGAYRAINVDDANVLAYLRTQGDRNILVALNMSGQNRVFVPTLDGTALNAAEGQQFLSSPQEQTFKNGRIQLQPYGVWIGAVTKESALRPGSVPLSLWHDAFRVCSSDQ